MGFEIATFLVWLAYLWICVGAVVAALFVLIGIGRVEENSRGAYIFRPLIVPGVLLLWPIVLARWIALERGDGNWQKRYRPLREAHGGVWLILAILVPAIFIGSLALRQTLPADGGAVQLEDPAR